jgi:CSLREA domain-containing protein
MQMAAKKSSRKNRAVEALATGAAIALGSSLIASDASAAVIEVTTTSDTTATDGECTLREALNNANSDGEFSGGDCTAGAGLDTITFKTGVTGTITLAEGTLYIYDSVDIQGPGRDDLYVDGDGSDRVFNIYLEGGNPVVSISGLTITNGYSYSGAGIRAEDATLTIANARISNNFTYYNTDRGGGDGGGIAFYDGTSLTITNTIITGNTADEGNGGGIFIDGSGTNVLLDNVQLTDNTAEYGGGGLDASFTFGGSLIIRDSTITGNNGGSGEGSEGGGVSVRNFGAPSLASGGPEGSVSKARGTRTPAERAASRKARAQATASTRQHERSLRAKPAGLPIVQVIIEDTTVATNTSYSDGGGLSIHYSGDLQIRRTTVSGNIAGDDGGGASITYSAGIIENSTFAENTSQYAAALNIEYSSLTIKETTVSGNIATGPDSTTSAVLIQGDAPVLITNTIIANTTGDLDLLAAPYADVTLSYTLVQDPPPDPKGWTEGPGNIYGQDPQLGPLQNNGGTTETMEPALASPVVNAGDPAFVGPPLDQRDAPRVSGGRIDMGSVEVQIVVLVPGAFQFASPTYSVNEGGDVTITVNREGGTDGAVSVNVTVTAGTATNGTDYTFAGATLTWADGETGPKTFVIPALADLDVDPAETVTLSLQAPTGGATLGVQSTTVLTINDVVVSGDIPTLGFLMKLLLVLGVGATGVVVMGRGRLLVYLLAALLALSTAPGVNAAQRDKKPRAMKRAKPNVDVSAVTVQEISRQGNLVTLKADGQTLTLRANRIQVRDRRGNSKGRPSLTSLQAGTTVMMRVRRGNDGGAQRVRLVLFDSLEMAKQAVAKRPAVR